MAVAVAGLLALSPAAWSFFSSSGSGSASATVGTLAAPSNVSGSPSGTTVSLTWTETTAPGGGPVGGYYVQRSGGAAGGSCASSAASPLHSSFTSCTDTAVPTGTFTYTVVAVYRSWTASAASDPVSVAPAPVVVDHFEVTAPAGIAAGTAFTVSVTAKDASGTTATGDTGTVRFSSTDAQAVLPADYSFLAADSGTRTFADGATLRTAGNHSLTVDDGAEPAKVGSAAVTVGPATASRVAFVQQPTSAIAGITLTPAVTVRIEDQFGNLTTSTNNVNMAVSGGSATLVGITSKAGISGVATFADLSLRKSGTYMLIATGPGLTGGTSASFTISPGVASGLAFTSSNVDCSSGRARVGNGGTLTSRVSAVDAYGNPVAVSSSRAVTLENDRSNAGLSPTSLSIAAGASETSATFGQSIPIGSPPDHVVIASSSGLSSTTCLVNKN